MTKTELIKAIQNEVSIEIPQKDVAEILDAISTVVVGTLKENKEEKVTLPGLGTFKVKEVGERSGVAALAGGKAWTKPAHSEITFKISRSIKELA